MPGLTSLFGGGGSPSAGANFGSGFSINTPYYTGNVSGSNITVTRLPTWGTHAYRTNFPRILQAYEGLRGQLKPGFGALTQANLTGIRDVGQQARGTLRNALGRRRLSGSSFATNAFMQQARDQAQQEAAARAQSTLGEINANNQILQQEMASINDAVKTELADSSITSGLAQNLLGVANANSQAAKQMSMENAAGAGSILGAIGGTLLGPTLQSAGQGFSNWLFPSSAASTGINIGSTAPISIPVNLPYSLP